MSSRPSRRSASRPAFIGAVAVVNRPGFTAAKQGDRILCEVISAHLDGQAGHPPTIVLEFEKDYQMEVTFDGGLCDVTYPKFVGFVHLMAIYNLPSTPPRRWWNEAEKKVATDEAMRRGIDVFHVYPENVNEHYELRFLCEAND